MFYRKVHSQTSTNISKKSEPTIGSLNIISDPTKRQDRNNHKIALKYFRSLNKTNWTQPASVFNSIYWYSKDHALMMISSLKLMNMRPQELEYECLISRATISVPEPFLPLDIFRIFKLEQIWTGQQRCKWDFRIHKKPNGTRNLNKTIELINGSEFSLKKHPIIFDDFTPIAG